MPSEYEREIDEILQRLDELGPRRSRLHRFSRWLGRRWEAFAEWVRSLPNAVAADQLMVAAIVFVVAAFFLRFVVPPAARWVGVAGVLLFLLAFALSLRQIWGSGRREVRWRGRIIDMDDGRPTLADRLILWFRRQFRR